MKQHIYSFFTLLTLFLGVTQLSGMQLAKQSSPSPLGAFLTEWGKQNENNTNVGVSQLSNQEQTTIKLNLEQALNEEKALQRLDTPQISDDVLVARVDNATNFLKLDNLPKEIKDPISTKLKNMDRSDIQGISFITNTTNNQKTIKEIDLIIYSYRLSKLGLNNENLNKPENFISGISQTYNDAHKALSEVKKNKTSLETKNSGLLWSTGLGITAYFGGIFGGIIGLYKNFLPRGCWVSRLKIVRHDPPIVGAITGAIAGSAIGCFCKAIANLGTKILYKCKIEELTKEETGYNNTLAHKNILNFAAQEFAKKQINLLQEKSATNKL